MQGFGPLLRVHMRARYDPDMPTFTLGPPLPPPPEPVEDVGEYWRARTAMGHEARAGKRGDADKLLTAAGVKFEWKNGGPHLIMQASDGRVVDFWPSTSKWTIRGETEVRRGGLKKILALCNARPPLPEPEERPEGPAPDTLR